VEVVVVVVDVTVLVVVVVVLVVCEMDEARPGLSVFSTKTATNVPHFLGQTGVSHGDCLSLPAADPREFP
jgi:hypothetical protein